MSLFDAGLQRLELGVELGIAVVDRVLDRDEADAVQVARRRVEAAVGAHRHLEVTLAVDDAVEVAGGAVGAADAARLGRGRIHRRVERRETIDAATPAATDDSSPTRAASRRGSRTPRSDAATTKLQSLCIDMEHLLLRDAPVLGEWTEDGRSRVTARAGLAPRKLSRGTLVQSTKNMAIARCELTQIAASLSTTRCL